MYNPGTLHKRRDSESPGMGPGNLHFENIPAYSLASSGLGTLFNHPGELLRLPLFSHQITPWNNLA